MFAGRERYDWQILCQFRRTAAKTFGLTPRNGMQPAGSAMKRLVRQIELLAIAVLTLCVVPVSAQIALAAQADEKPAPAAATADAKKAVPAEDEQNADKPATDPAQAKVGFYVAEAEEAEGLTAAEIEGREGETVYLHAEPALTRDDVAQANVVVVTGHGQAVNIEFTPAGAAKMTEVSQQNRGKRLAIVMDGKVLAAPKMMSKMSGRAQIMLGRGDADDLCAAIDPAYRDRAAAAEERANAARVAADVPAPMPLPKVTDADRLRQIGQALRKAHDARQQFPDVAMRDAAGRPLLSWRVAILPFLPGGRELFQRFRVDEAWDSPHNRPLADEMPDVYRTAKSAPGQTRFLAAVGEKLSFSPQPGKRNAKSFTDGTALTILAVEADAEHAVVWTRPDDLAVDLASPKRGITDGEANFLVLFADGQSRDLKGSIRGDLLRALFTRGGGERIEPSMVAQSEIAPRQ